MTENEIAEIVKSELFRDQLAKGVLGFIAGALASELTKKTYDRAMKAYRLKKAVAEQ